METAASRSVIAPDGGGGSLLSTDRRQQRRVGSAVHTENAGVPDLETGRRVTQIELVPWLSVGFRGVP